MEAFKQKIIKASEYITRTEKEKCLHLLKSTYGLPVLQKMDAIKIFINFGFSDAVSVKTARLMMKEIEDALKGMEDEMKIPLCHFILERSVSHQMAFQTEMNSIKLLLTDALKHSPDVSKNKMEAMSFHLKLLFHAKKCNLENCNQSCATGKIALKQISQCIEEKCAMHLCDSCKVLMKHWQMCTNANCLCCIPVQDFIDCTKTSPPSVLWRFFTS